MNKANDEAAIRALLPRAWHAFFGRFGRLTEIQRLAAAPIAGGRDVLVSAPTASGKTEAVLAPLVERLRAEPVEGAHRDEPRIIVVCPTRALVNDLFRRVRGPLLQTGLGAVRKTADSPGFPASGAKTGASADLLVTTPESLDSLLSRHPAKLRRVMAVVLDELQLLARTARGDQLRCLLTRLDRVASTPPQRCASTATVADPSRLVLEFLGSDAHFIQTAGGAEGQRSIEASLAPAATLDDAVSVISDVVTRADGPAIARKALVFANTRAEVEGLAAGLSALPALRTGVYAHHGSLSRDERLRVESQLRTASRALCVATMTLELGIDVGDVDLVVLIAPPPDVASLLQRAGRGNRREAVTRVLGLYQGDLEHQRFEHLLECARAGRLFDEPLTFRPTLLAQQALSLLLQSRRGWVSAAALNERLPGEVRSTWTRSDCEAVLRKMAEAGYVRSVDKGRFVVDELARPLLERGQVHSMIDDVREREVVDAVTGRPLGRARFGRSDSENVASGGELSLSLGGKRRQVMSVRDDKVFVMSEDGADKARFLSREAPRYSAALAQDFARFLGVESDTMLLSLQRGSKKQVYRLDHFLGSTWGRVLEWLLTSRGHRASGASAFSLVVEKPLETLAPLFTDSDEDLLRKVETLLARHRKALARRLGAGPFRDEVPEDLLDRWIAESLDVDGLVRRLRAAVVEEAPEVG